MDSCALCRMWKRSLKPFPNESETREKAQKHVKFTRTILKVLPKTFKTFTIITKPSKCLAKEKENKQTNKQTKNEATEAKNQARR